MYCPKCGREGSETQNFCRSCGVDLRRVSKALDTEFAPGELETSVKLATRRAVRFATLASVVMFVGIVLGIIGKKITHEDVLVGVGAIIAIAAMFTMVVLFMLRAFTSASTGRKRTATGALDSADRPALPGERFAIPLPSVTEGTTRSLVADRRNPSDELPA